MTIVYETSCTATHHARNGSVRSEDGALDLALAAPKALGGAGGATNPEQLFAAGYAACFTSALLRVAREARAAGITPSVTVHSGLRSDGLNRYALFAQVAVSLPDVDPAVAQRLVDEAHAICPFSKAVADSLGVEVVLSASAEA